MIIAEQRQVLGIQRVGALHSCPNRGLGPLGDCIASTNRLPMHVSARERFVARNGAAVPGCRPQRFSVARAFQCRAAGDTLLLATAYDPFGPSRRSTPAATPAAQEALGANLMARSADHEFGDGHLRSPLAECTHMVCRNSGRVAPGTCISLPLRCGGCFRAKLSSPCWAFQTRFFR